MNLPLVSVITPTWQRHDMLLDRCIPSVQAQSYPAVEHIVISDGPDPALLEKLTAQLGASVRLPLLGMLSAAERGGRWGVKPRLRGLEMASGELITYLDDDDAFRPDHCALLVGALKAHPDAGMAYSKMASHGAAMEPPGGTIIGGPELGPCAVGSPMIMHRRELLELATWGPPDPMEDWRLVDRWLERGVIAYFVDRITVDVWPSPYRS
jgi:glycosyltransferase involved in cell wall biosynthesis